MNDVVLHQGISKELTDFPYILEFVHKKINTIHLNSFNLSVTTALSIYFIIDGKFNWVIDNTEYNLFPGDMAVVLPGQSIGGKTNLLNIGTLIWVKLDAQSQLLGAWSSLTVKEKRAIERILTQNKENLAINIKRGHELLSNIEQELHNEEIGFYTRVAILLDELLILFSRQVINQNISKRDFPQTFLKLENILRMDLAHQWSVEEMAAFAGIGTTAFTEKVKSYSGFSPLNYLINLRITEAIKLLKRNEINITEIALNVGFYSSQHFSTTFKKLTGYTPSEFRKNNTSIDS